MGALQLLNFVQLLIPMLAMMNTAVFVYIGFVVVYCFQVIGMIGSGLCMVRWLRNSDSGFATALTFSEA